jgi:hypothetical protein
LFWLDDVIVTSPALLTAVGPFAQARNAAQKEDKEKRAHSNWKKVTVQEWQKGVASSTKMDYMRLRNGSTNDTCGARVKIMICIQDLSPR